MPYLSNRELGRCVYDHVRVSTKARFLLTLGDEGSRAPTDWRICCEGELGALKTLDNICGGRIIKVDECKQGVGTSHFEGVDSEDVRGDEISGYFEPASTIVQRDCK